LIDCDKLVETRRTIWICWSRRWKVQRWKVRLDRVRPTVSTLRCRLIASPAAVRVSFRLASSWKEQTLHAAATAAAAADDDDAVVVRLLRDVGADILEVAEEDLNFLSILFPLFLFFIFFCYFVIFTL